MIQTIPAFPELGLIVVVMCIAISLLVFAVSGKKRVNLLFAGSTIVAGIWILINTVLLPLKLGDLQLLVSFSFATGLLTLLLIWYFTFYYGQIQLPKYFAVFNWVITAISVIFILLSFTKLIISDIYYRGDSLILEYGTFYIPNSMLFLSLFLIIAFTLQQKKKREVGITKKQLEIFFAGFIITAGISLATNLVLPPLFNDSNSSRVGPLGMIFFLTFTAYAILRHRFLDIRVLIGRIVYYLTLSVLPITSFFFLVFIYESLFGTVFTAPVYFMSIFIGIGFVLLFNTTNEFLRNEVNSRLINPGYNPLQVAEKLSNQLSVMIDLGKIIEAVINTIQITIRPDFSGVIIFPDEKHNYNRIFPSSLVDKVKNADGIRNSISTLWNAMGKHPVIFDEIDFEISDGIYRNLPNIAVEVKKQMEVSGAKVILAVGDVGDKDTVIGMYLIGQKEADSTYTSTDIDFLKSIANTGGLAIERSLLTNEVQEFANTLQGKVDQATSELRKSNAELETALAELKEARRVERDMIDVMGHELRTPISIVRNALVMLDKQAQQPAKSVDLGKYLEMALESTRREITLIETLLSATKVDNARMQLYLTKVDFRDVVNDGIEGQKNQVAQKNLEIAYTPPAEDVFVFADRTRVQEVMDNLYSNAVKYTPKGKVELALWKDDNFGWISVKDTGIGISEEDIQNLGKKFFRAKQYINDTSGERGEVVRPGGTGLGLYVIFDLIKIMGGSLYINSKVGEGSKFTFSIPLYKDQKDKQIDQTFDRSSDGDRGHVYLNQQPPEPGVPTPENNVSAAIEPQQIEEGASNSTEAEMPVEQASDNADPVVENTQTAKADKPQSETPTEETTELSMNHEPTAEMPQPTPESTPNPPVNN